MLTWYKISSFVVLPSGETQETNPTSLLDAAAIGGGKDGAMGLQPHLISECSIGF